MQTVSMPGTEAGELLEQDAKSIKEHLEDRSLPITSLIKLYRYEQDHENRSLVLEALDDSMSIEDLAETLSLPKRLAAAIDTVPDAEAIAGLYQHSDTYSDLATCLDENVDTVTGTLDEFDQRELKQLEEMERLTLNRKTVIDAIEQRLSDDTVSSLEAQVLGQEQDRREELEELLEDHGVERERLERASLHDLETLAAQFDEEKQQQQRREALIDELKKGGLPETQLRQATTEDLAKLANARSSDDGETDTKTIDEIRDEAKQDLQQLRQRLDGINKDSETLIDRLRDTFFTEDRRAKQAVKTHRITQTLEAYRNKDPHEAAIKTAYVTKGVIEDELDLGRNTTYQGVANKVNDVFPDLASFFETIHRTHYTEEVDIEDVDRVIDVCKHAVQQLDQLEG